jgi:hypothetical protein
LKSTINAFLGPFRQNPAICSRPYLVPIAPAAKANKGHQRSKPFSGTNDRFGEGFRSLANALVND